MMEESLTMLTTALVVRGKWDRPHSRSTGTGTQRCHDMERAAGRMTGGPSH
jgi:hypothetical protein